MLNEKRIVEGFVFENDGEYQMALKDAEMFDILWDKIRKSDRKVAIELYDTLLSCDKVKTVVGMYNIKLLQNYLVQNGYISEENVTPIVGFVGRKISTADALKSYEYSNRMKYMVNQKINNKLEKYKATVHTLKIVVLILSVVIAVMFAVQANGGTANYASAKEAVIDEYSEWEQDLNDREKEVKEKEEELKVLKDN